MRIVSNKEKKEYLRAMRQNLDAWTNFGCDRFTGVVWGNFFYITHHTDWEWDRRVTSAKHRAVGFVTSSEGGCTVRCLIFPGYTDPVSLVMLYLVGMLVFMLKGADISQPLWHILSAVVVLVVSLTSCIPYLFVDRAQEGRKTLLDLLHDPVPVWEK